MIECVVFDIDDTLFLERDYARSGFEAVGMHVEKATGNAGFFLAAWAAFERGIRGRIFDVALEEIGLGNRGAWIPELVSVYRKHRPNVALLPDARLALDTLAGRVHLAGVTDGPTDSQRNKAEALGLAGRLSPLVFTGDLGAGFGKPNPRAFEMVEAATGARRQACLYVADNPAKDFAAPRSLGWCTLRVRRRAGLHYKADSGPDVDQEVEDLVGLPSAIGLGR